MYNRFVFVVFSLFFYYSFSLYDDCSYTDSSTTFTWDLSPLTYDPSNSHPVGYYGISNEGNMFYLNYCEMVSENIASNACNKNYPTGSCQDNNGIYFSAGIISDIVFSTYYYNNITTGVSLYYGNGDFCSSQSKLRDTTINVICDSSAITPFITNITEDACSYTIFVNSTYGCPNSFIPQCQPYIIDPILYETIIVFGKNTHAELYSNGDCNLGVSGTVWYQLSLRFGYTISLSTCGSNIDTLLGIYKGSCSNLQCYKHSDGCSTKDLSLYSSSDDTYYISVSGKTEQDKGTFQLSVSANVLQDLGCYNSFQIPSFTSSIIIQGSLLSGYQTTQNSCGLNSGIYAIWYKLTPFSTATNVNVSLCNSKTNFNALLSIYNGNDCSSLSCTEYDMSCTTSYYKNTGEILFTSEANLIHYIVISTDILTTLNSYELIISIS